MKRSRSMRFRIERTPGPVPGQRPAARGSAPALARRSADEGAAPALPVAGGWPSGLSRDEGGGDGPLGEAVALAHKLARQGLKSGEASERAAEVFGVDAMAVARAVSPGAAFALSHKGFLPRSRRGRR